MPNLSINPAIAVPGLQDSDNFPTSATAHALSNSGKSSFSKLLANAVNLKQNRSEVSVTRNKTNFQPTGNDDNEQRPVTKENFKQPESTGVLSKKPAAKQAMTQDSHVKQPTIDQSTVNKPTVEQPTVMKPTGTKLQDSAMADDQDEPVVKELPGLSDNDTDAKKTDKNGQAVVDPTNAGMVSPLGAQVLLNQPMPVVTEDVNFKAETTPKMLEITKTPVEMRTAQILQTNLPVTQSHTFDPAVLKGTETMGPFERVLNQEDSSDQRVNNQAAAMMPNDVMPPVGVLPDNNLGAKQTQGVVNSAGLELGFGMALGSDAAVTAQSIAGLTNLSSNGAVNPASQDLTAGGGGVTQNKTKGSEKFGEVMKGQTAAEQTSVTDLGKDGSDLTDNGAAVTGNGKLSPNAAALESLDSNPVGELSGGRLKVIHATANEGKPQTLNMPVIQTQLAVSKDGEKTRTDVPLDVTVHNQAVPSMNSDIAETNRTHINKEDLFSQIAEKSKMALNNGNGEMEFSLKPEHLGKLHLKVSLENQLVTAKFVAESQQVKEVIETNLNQLRRNLQDNGIQVDRLTVSVDQQNNGNAFQNASHNQDGTAYGQSSTLVKHEVASRSGEPSPSPSPREKRPRGETAIDLIA
jgi:flagellar hook-length control protein FliK